MLIPVAAVVLLAAAWMLGALLLVATRAISFHQAFFLLPVRILHRAELPPPRAVKTQAPVLYAVLHQSKLDPAVMLSLLPDETLHILDEASARSPWLEPWREMARTIAFNPRHVFVSRRLVRHLRGRGRLAVYFPDGVQPDTRAYRLYRAVARIAEAAGASVVAISVRGARETPLGFTRPRRFRLFGKLRVQALEPATMAELVALSPRRNATMAAALFDRVGEADRG